MTVVENFILRKDGVIVGMVVRVLMGKLMMCCDSSSSGQELTFYIDASMATSPYVSPSGLVDTSNTDVHRVVTMMASLDPWLTIALTANGGRLEIGTMLCIITYDRTLKRA
jgi:hypothetical protein